MGRHAFESNDLAQHAVVRLADRKTGIVRRCVRQHAKVGVVQFTEPQQFRLSSEIFDLAIGPLLQPPLEFEILLGRHRKERYGARKLWHYAGLFQAAGNTQHCADLAVVAAGVRGAGHGVGQRMFRHKIGVEFAHNDHVGPRRPAVQGRFHAGDGDSAPRLKAHAPKHLCDQRRGLHLFVAGLRVLQYLAGNADDLVRVTINAFDNALLKGFRWRGRGSGSVLCEIVSGKGVSVPAESPLAAIIRPL